MSGVDTAWCAVGSRVSRTRAPGDRGQAVPPASEPPPGALPQVMQRHSWRCCRAPLAQPAQPDL